MLSQSYRNCFCHSYRCVNCVKILEVGPPPENAPAWDLSFLTRSPVQWPGTQPFAQAGHVCHFSICKFNQQQSLAMYPRNRHRNMYTHKEVTNTAGHTHCHRQGAAFTTELAYRTRIRHKPRQPRPLLLLGWQRQVTMHHTHHTLQVHKYMHIQGCPEHSHSLSACLAPLPGSWLPYSPHPMGPWLTSWSSWVLIANTQRYPTIMGSRIPAQILCPSDITSWMQEPYSQVNSAWSCQWIHKHISQTPTDAYLHQLAAGTWAVTCASAPAAGTCLISSHLSHSRSCFWEHILFWPLWLGG